MALVPAADLGGEAEMALALITAGSLGAAWRGAPPAAVRRSPRDHPAAERILGRAGLVARRGLGRPRPRRHRGQRRQPPRIRHPCRHSLAVRRRCRSWSGGARRTLDEAAKSTKKLSEDWRTSKSRKQDVLATANHQLGMVALFAAARRRRGLVQEVPRDRGSARQPARHGAELPPARHGRAGARPLDDAEAGTRSPSPSGKRSATGPAWRELPPARHRRAAARRARRRRGLVQEVARDRGGARQPARHGRNYHQLGMVAQDRGALDDAEAWYKKSLAIKEALGDRPGMAPSYHQLGMVAQERGALDEAEAWYKKSLAIRGARQPASRKLPRLGMVAQDRGRSTRPRLDQEIPRDHRGPRNRPGLALTYTFGVLKRGQTNPCSGSRLGRALRVAVA